MKCNNNGRYTYNRCSKDRRLGHERNAEMCGAIMSELLKSLTQPYSIRNTINNVKGEDNNESI
jgi:hypothetical protein